MHAPRAVSSRGFSLLQLIVALGIFAVLMTVAFRAYSNARASAVASVCSGRLKAIAMDLERYRVDHHAYPAVLDELYPTYTKSEEALRCPEENRPDVRTYSDFYVPRDPKEQHRDRLVLSCPFHQETGKGIEVFLGDVAVHERGKTYVATLTGGAGLASVLPYDAERPWDAEPEDPEFWANAFAAMPNMEVGPVDRVRVSSDGVTLKFKDGSRAEITGPAEVMVVDCFRSTAERGEPSPFYTILRLARGQVYNIVIPGSKYEVVTPTGTAGARGTEFLVTYVSEGVGAPLHPGKGKGKGLAKGKFKPKGKASTEVVRGKVYLTGRYTTVELAEGDSAEVDERGNAKKKKKK